MTTKPEAVAKPEEKKPRKKRVMKPRQKKDPAPAVTPVITPIIKPMDSVVVQPPITKSEPAPLQPSDQGVLHELPKEDPPKSLWEKIVGFFSGR